MHRLLISCYGVQSITRAIGACAQVVNHGIPQDLVDGMFAASAR